MERKVGKGVCMTKKISLLGATGSIGIQTLDIIGSNPDKFKLVSFSAGMNIDKVREIVSAFHPQIVSVIRQEDAQALQEEFPSVGFMHGEEGLIEIASRTGADITRIGRGAKIDNLVHVGHNCQIGEDVVIAAQTGLSGSIVIEKDVVLGGQVGIGEHARIEEGVMLGGQGGVLPNKVLRGKGVAFWGTPARPVREYLKQLAALARLARKE